MKKVLFIGLFALISTGASAQIHNHAIGVRGGAGTFGVGGEISYQKGFSDINRLELDLGWNTNGSKNAYDAFVATGIYHWVGNLAKGLNWYLGPGAQLAYKSFKYNSDYNTILFGIGGQVGLEYDFSAENNVPLLLGLDFRSMAQLGTSKVKTKGYVGYGIAFSLRYVID